MCIVQTGKMCIVQTATHPSMKEAALRATPLSDLSCKGQRKTYVCYLDADVIAILVVGLIFCAFSVIGTSCR